MSVQLIITVFCHTDSYSGPQYLFRGINPDTPRNLAKAVTVD